MIKANKLLVGSWGLGGVVSAAAIIVWIQAMGKLHITSYSLFPVFGLLAFSLMWTHYIIGAFRRYSDVPFSALKQYFKITGVVVLACILLHPVLLIFQLWRDGFGLPPNSYLEHYVAPGGKLAVLLGSMSLIILLLFELKRWYGKKPWWKFVEYAQIVAMLVMFYHALTLGGALQIGWYHTLWLFYGVTFFIAISYGFIFNTRKEEKKS